MGVLDKLKNALFEVEYVEVEDEAPKKEKKDKKKKKEKVKEEKPIAKKIVLPGKREDKVEEIHEEELKDEDFEIRPKDEAIKAKEEFKFMDDNDFKVEDEFSEEPEIVKVFDDEEPKVEERETVPVEVRKTREERVSEQYSDYYAQPQPDPEPEPEPQYTPKPAYSTPRESKPYGVDDSYKLPVHEYGTYEKKEEKTYFKPSPIISPIYGILDKNYKKEDVREKREVRLTGSYSKNVSVDDIRNKAYGERRRLERNKDVEEDTTKFEVEEEIDNDDLLVDLSDRSKPEVKELTMGDAEEYFQDLGLEYNVDYVDVSTDTPKKEKPKKLEEKPVEEKKTEEVVEIKEEIKEEKIEEPVEEVPEVKEDTKVEEETDNDNLFDLIDSMYQENE